MSVRDGLRFWFLGGIGGNDLAGGGRGGSGKWDRYGIGRGGEIDLRIVEGGYGNSR